MDIESLAKRQENQSAHRQLLVDNLGIFELRALGRKLGVASPTTKKRDALIDLIMDKIYSSDGSVVRISKKGRPCKNLSNIDDIVAKVTGNSMSGAFPIQRRPLKYEDVVVFAQDVPVFSEVEEKIEEFSGVIRQAENVAYLIDPKTRKMAFILKHEMEEYKLAAGDYVEMIASTINTQDQFLASNILTVNGEKADARNEEAIEEGQPIISMDKLKYGDNYLHCGRRNLIEIKNNIFENDFFIDFAKFCKENDYHLITLALNTCFEDQIIFNQIPTMINMTTEYGRGFDEGFDKVIDTVAHAERLLATGKKCVVFISDIMSVINTLDCCFDDEEVQNGHKVKGLVIMQKLITLGKALSNGASVTLIITHRQEDKDDKFIVNELNRVCSKFYE